MRRLWRVTRWLSRGQAGRLLPALAGLALGLFLLAFFISLAEGLRRNVVEPVLGALPDEIQVTPSEERVKPGFSNDPMMTFSKKDLRAMRRLDGVAELHPEVVSRFGVMIGMSLPGFRQETLAFLAGLPQDLVRDDLPEEDPRRFTWEEGQSNVPVLLSPLVATVWNTGFGEAFSAPRMPRDRWIGIPLAIVISNEKTFESVRLRGDVVGFSRRVDVVAVPRELVEHYNRKWDRSNEPGRVHVKVRKPRELATVVAQLKDQGWYVTDRGETGRRVSRGLRIGEAALGLVGLVLAVVSLVNLSTVLLLSLRERRYELAVLRAYGAGRSLIAGALGMQAAVVGLVGALLGLGLALLAARVVDAAALPLLEPALGRVGSLFRLSGPWIAAILLGAPLAALAAALQPALAAGRMNLTEVLRR